MIDSDSISQRFALPVLIFASVVMVVLGKADTLLFERVRIIFADVAAPVLAIISQPVAAVDRLAALSEAVDAVTEMVEFQLSE